MMLPQGHEEKGHQKTPGKKTERYVDNRFKAQLDGQCSTCNSWMKTNGTSSTFD